MQLTRFEIKTFEQLLLAVAKVTELLSRSELTVQEILEVHYRLSAITDVAQDWHGVLPKRLELIKRLSALNEGARAYLDDRGGLRAIVGCYVEAISELSLTQNQQSVRELLSILSGFKQNSVQMIANELVADMAYGNEGYRNELLAEYGIPLIVPTVSGNLTEAEIADGITRALLAFKQNNDID